MLLVRLFLQAFPKLFRRCKWGGMLDIRCEEIDIEVGQEFAVDNLLVAIRLDERGGRLLPQVIEGKAIVVPKPHLWDLQPTVDLEAIEASACDDHLNRKVWHVLVCANTVAIVRFRSTPVSLLPKRCGAFGVVFRIRF